MKRIRKSGLTKNVKSIIKQLNEIKKLLVMDTIVSNFDIVTVNKYFANVSYEEGIINIAKAIIKEEDIANQIIMEAVKNNNKNIKSFLDFSVKELEREYAKGLIPGVHGVKSIAPDMMILYYISNNLEKDDKYYSALNFLNKDYEDFEKYQEQYEDVIKVKGLERTLFEHEINAFYNGTEISLRDVTEDEILEDLCERYKAKLTEDKQMIINPQIIKFYDNEAVKIVHTKDLQKAVSSVILSIARKTFNYLKYSKGVEELYLQIDKLKKEKVSLENETQFLKEKLDDVSKVNKKDDIIKLEKENYYLKSQVEKLELENAELLQTIKELKEIVEDLPITIDKIEPTNVYEDQSIVVVGGHWTEKEKDNVRASYIADFIESEDIIKYTERIKNYDLIVFDTSRNSHINFNRLKNNSKLRLISVSKKDRIDELFIK